MFYSQPDNCDNVQESASDELGTTLSDRLLVKLQSKGRQNIENIVQKLQKDNLFNRNSTHAQVHFETVTGRKGFTDSDDMVLQNSVILPQNARNVTKHKGTSPRKRTTSKRKKVTPCQNIPVTEGFTELKTYVKEEISNNADHFLIDNTGIQYNIIGEVMNATKVEPLSLGDTSLQGGNVEEEDSSSREDIVIGSEVKSVMNLANVNDSLVQTITNADETYVDETDTWKVADHASVEKGTAVGTCGKTCDLSASENALNVLEDTRKEKETSVGICDKTCDLPASENTLKVLENNRKEKETTVSTCNKTCELPTSENALKVPEHTSREKETTVGDKTCELPTSENTLNVPEHASKVKETTVGTCDKTCVLPATEKTLNVPEHASTEKETTVSTCDKTCELPTSENWDNHWEQQTSENTFKVPQHTRREKVTAVAICDKNCELPTFANESLPTRLKGF